MKEIDLSTWKRKEHFEFFSSFDEPFYGVVCEVKCTKSFDYCKQNGISFFAYYLHKTMVAVNGIHEFRTRIVDNKPVEFPSIHASATIGRADETFGFSFVPYNESFEAFQAELNKEIKRVQATPGLAFNSDVVREDVIHFSTLPWNQFTGLSHARDFKSADSAPKITIGKAYKKEGNWYMQVAINAHHGLTDGLHASKFLAQLEELLNT